MRSSTRSYSSHSANASGSPSRSRAAVSIRLCLWYWRSRLRAIPNSHGAPEPSATSRKRLTDAPGLRERLGGQVEGGGLGPRLALEPRRTHTA